MQKNMIQEQLHSLDDVRFMRLALVEAKKAYEMGEIPVGCVIVADNQIVGRGHNLTETLQDITAHAEMQAITAATNRRKISYTVHVICYFGTLCDVCRSYRVGTST